MLNEISLITVRSPNFRTRSTTSITGESVGINMINNDEIRMTKSEGNPKLESRKNYHESFELQVFSLFRTFSLVSPNLGEDQVQLLRFHPELPRFWFEFRHRANNHPKEVFRLARLFPTCADILEKFLL